MSSGGFSSVSGITLLFVVAADLLLPFSSHILIFGQCRSSPFTHFDFSPHFGAIQLICLYLFVSSPHFRAMQPLSFYPFHLFSPFSGNAAAFLLPFLPNILILGQCSRSPFTLFA
jgi:hypothetical protein